MRLLGGLSAVALNLVIWGFIAAVMLGGTFLMIKWGQERRRWLWRISISWSILFLVSVVTLLVVLIPLGRQLVLNE
jgi:hypothetical protein